MSQQGWTSNARGCWLGLLGALAWTVGSAWGSDASTGPLPKRTSNAPVVDDFPRPRGIYALDNFQGDCRDQNVRDYPFVRGYAWRMGWPNFESDLDKYDSSAVDCILARLEPIGKKLTIRMQQDNDYVPAYVAATPGVVTYSYVRDGVERTGAAPWDPYVIERFRRFTEALAAHTVWDSSSGRWVALRDHPLLASVDLGIPGLGPIRDSYAQRLINIKDIPCYDRNSFIETVKASLHAVADQFPNQFCFIGFWAVRDNVASPPLWQEMNSAILAEFDGIGAPRIGYFQENLGVNTPTPTYAATLFAARDDTFVTFEAVHGFRGQGQQAADALDYAYETFNATSVALYVVDLDDSNQWPSLEDWDSLIGP